MDAGSPVAHALIFIHIHLSRMLAVRMLKKSKLNLYFFKHSLTVGARRVPRSTCRRISRRNFMASISRTGGADVA